MTTRFRVWDGEEMHEPPHQFLIGSDGSVFKRQEVEPAPPGGPVNAEVMHSTGLTDAEGREVWDGDILELVGYPEHEPGPPPRFPVRWEAGRGIWVAAYPTNELARPLHAKLEVSGPFVRVGDCHRNYSILTDPYEEVSA